MRISMHGLQCADKILIAALAVLQPLRFVRHRPRPGGARCLLLIKFWGLGSVQLLTPAARSVRAAHRGATLAFLTLAQNREFARALGVFDDVITLDVTGVGFFHILARIAVFMAGLRRARFDAVYDFELFARFSAVVDQGSRVTLAPVSGPGVVVLNDTFYPGWEAYDEQSRQALPIHPANVAFRAVVLKEKRSYRIVFRYVPPWLDLSLLLVGAGIMVTGLLVVSAGPSPPPGEVSARAA